MSAQKTTITVIDSLTREPIPYASVCFIELKSGTYTNDYGSFKLDSANNSCYISHIGYLPRMVRHSISVDTIKLQPETYSLDEVKVSPKKNKGEEVGFTNYKSQFFCSGFSGSEIAVYIPNNSGQTKYIKEVKICFGTQQRIKEFMGINFVSVFKINFYSKKTDTFIPDSSLLSKDLVYTSKIIKPNTILDLSDQYIRLPKEGAFLSIEWVGIESETTKEIITNYTEHIEPFLSTTFEDTGAKVYERKKFKDLNWKLVDKNNIFSLALKKDNYFTPRVSVSVQ